MRILLTHFATLAALALSCQALRCWVCENAMSNSECLQRGKVERCMNNQESCETVMRQIDRGVLITKKCKQGHACRNNNMQNEMPAWFPTQCNGDSTASLCTCCCLFDECNTFSNCQSSSPKCSEPKIPEHGSRTCDIQPNNIRGTNCEYSCDEGYTLSGSSTSSCTAAKPHGSSWNPPAPECIRIIKCGEQAAPSNGMVACSNKDNLQSECTFSCDDGFELNGEESTTCLAQGGDSGEWSNPAPTCLQVPLNNPEGCPPHILMDACIILDSSSSVRRKNWPTVKNFAKNIINLFKMSRDDTQFSVFSYDTRVHRDSQILFNKYGTDKNALISEVDGLEYHSGLTMTGGALEHARDVIFAPGNGQRDGVRKVIILVTDGNSDATSPVKEVAQDLRDRGTLIYAIGVGFDIDPDELLDLTGTNEQVFYQEDGFDTLDKNLADAVGKKICERGIYGDICEEQVAPQNGDMMCSQNNDVNSVCVFKCDDDFVLEGDSFIMCQQKDSGISWTSSSPSCVKLFDEKCEAPVPPPNGRILCSAGNDLNSVCSFNCDSGYRIEGSLTSECVKDNTKAVWTFVAPRCIAAPKCDVMRAPTNGQVSCTSGRDLESVCTFSCLPEYSLDVQQTATCFETKDGADWSTGVPTCVRDVCDELHAPTNGDFICSAGNDVNSVCAFNCDDGFLMDGDSFSLCERRDFVLAWSSNVPSCVEIPACRVATAPTDGTVSCTSGGDISSVCTYTCNDGYKLSNLNVVTCLESTEGAEWSSEAPRCVEIPKCSNPQTPTNGQVSCTSGSDVNSVCSYSCNDGYRMLEPHIVTCLEVEGGAEWSTNAPLCQLIPICDSAVSPTFGQVTCTSGGDLNSVCTFTCDEGYLLETEGTATCLETKDGAEWTNSSPRCVIIPTCSVATAPLNGQVSCTSGGDLGSVCSYSCNQGFKLDAEKTPTCQQTNLGLRWSTDPPLCVKESKIECPPHTLMDACIILDSSASVRRRNWPTMKQFAKSIIRSFDMSHDDARFSVFSYDTRVNRESQILFNEFVRNEAGLLAKMDRMNYNAGLTMTGKALNYARDVIFKPGNGKREGVRKVLIVVTDGDSDATSPVEEISQQLRDDGTLIYTVGIGFEVDPVKLAEISGNTQRTFYVEEGFTFLNRGLANSIGRAICDDEKCTPLEAPSNGQISCSSGRGLHSTCFFSCNAGYELVGESMLGCEKMSAALNWNSTKPECREALVLKCDAHVAPPNGQMTCSLENELSSICEFSCEDGYKLEGESVSTCIEIGDAAQWSSVAPVCAEVPKCSNAQTPSNGQVSCTSGSDVGSVCSYSCNGGYRMLEPNIVTCLEVEGGAEWTTNAPLCQRIPICDTAASPTNGQVTCTSGGDLNSVCTFSCDEGYLLETEGTATCLETGGVADWTITSPRCVEIPKCSNAQTPSNGQVSCTSGSDVGSVCSYSCNGGYRMLEPNIVTCLEVEGGAEWSTNAPLCQIIPICDSAVSPTFGQVTCTSGGDLNSVCTFTCDEGYLLETEGTATCLETKDGAEWTNSSPRCVIIPTCSVATSPLNGQVSCTSGGDLGSVCSYSCNQGFKLDAEKTPTCQQTNLGPQWSTDPPLCVKESKIECPPHTLMDACIILDSSASVRRRNWPTMKQFAKSIIRSFDMSHDDARFAVFSYDTRVNRESQILFNEFVRNEAGLLAKMDRMNYNAGLTMTGKALNYARDVIFKPGNGKREGVRKVLIVVTDGDSDATSPVEEISQQLRDDGTLIYTVGIGFEVDPVKLAEISGSAQRTFYVEEGFTFLNRGLANSIGRAICDDEKCMPLEAPSNGQISCSSGRGLHSTCFFSCNAGYELVGESMLGCEKMSAALNWNSTIPECREALVPKCDAHVAPPNGQMTCSMENELSSICEFSCDDGYKLEGQSISTCTEIGGAALWSFVTPVCAEVLKCDAHVAPPNGQMTCSLENELSSICEFSCDDGYKLEGQSISTCTEIGGAAQWSSVAPVCAEVPKCDAHVAPSNGQMTCSLENELSSICEFSCDDGYKLEGQSILTCTEIGGAAQWSSVAPVCAEVLKCDAHVAPSNGQMTCSLENELSSICEFSCDDGYKLEGESVSTCTELDGAAQWSFVAPKCTQAKKKCPPHISMDACIVLDSSSSVRRRNWPSMINFAKLIIRSFDMSEDDVRFSVFSYDTRVHRDHEILLNDHISNVDSLTSQLDTMRYHGGLTMTGSALRHVRDVIFQPVNGRREGIKKVLIVITDGDSDATSPVEEISQQLRDDGTLIYTVGIGFELDPEQLVKISGAESRTYYQEDGFETLNEDLAHEIGINICDKESP